MAAGLGKQIGNLLECVVAQRIVLTSGRNNLRLGGSHRRVQPLAIDRQVHPDGHQHRIPAVGHRTDARVRHVDPGGAQRQVREIIKLGQIHGLPIPLDSCELGMQFRTGGNRFALQPIQVVRDLFVPQAIQRQQPGLGRDVQHAGQPRPATLQTLAQTDQFVLDAGDFQVRSQHVLLARAAGFVARVGHVTNLRQQLPLGFRDGGRLLDEVQLVVGTFHLRDRRQFDGRQLSPGHVCVGLGHAGTRVQLSVPGQLLARRQSERLLSCGGLDLLGKRRHAQHRVL